MGPRADADGSAAALDSAAAAKRLITAARHDFARRERTWRKRLLWAVVLSSSLSVAVAALVSIFFFPALNRQTEDIAQRTSAIVGGDVVRDAREARVVTGRAALTEANGRLIARQLPIVPDPGQNATGDELLIQAARANVLADLPESTVAALRREFAGRTTLPSSLTGPLPAVGDSVVTLLPIGPGTAPDGAPRTATPPQQGASEGGASPQPGGASSAGPATPAPSGPAPAPPADDLPDEPAPAAPRGLFPLLPDLPLRIPLLSE